MIPALKAAAVAGLLYFVTVFAMGFVLGALRTVFLVPRLGELAAVAIELPFMLSASWFACAWLLRRMPMVASVNDAVVMGFVAFTILMLAEFAFASLLFGEAPATYFQNLLKPAGILGLIGQLAFAAMPSLQLLGWL